MIARLDVELFANFDSNSQHSAVLSEGLKPAANDISFLSLESTQIAMAAAVEVICFLIQSSLDMNLFFLAHFPSH